MQKEIQVLMNERPTKNQIVIQHISVCVISICSTKFLFRFFFLCGCSKIYCASIFCMHIKNQNELNGWWPLGCNSNCIFSLKMIAHVCVCVQIEARNDVTRKWNNQWPNMLNRPRKKLAEISDRGWNDFININIYVHETGVRLPVSMYTLMLACIQQNEHDSPAK